MCQKILKGGAGHSSFSLSIQSLMVLYLSRAALLDRILDTVDEETNFINVDERNKQVEETSSHKGGRANNKNFSSEPYSLV